MTAGATAAGNRALVGIGWMLLTGLLFTCVTGIVRHLGSDMPAIEAAFLRYAIGLVLIVPMMRPLLRRGTRSRLIKLHAMRGFVHGIGVMLWFYAMARIPIAEVTAIGFISPIFVTVGAALFLGEALHKRRIAAVLIGFLGSMIILRPGFESVSLGQLAQLGAAPLFAVSYLIAKRLSDDDDPTIIVGLLSLFCTLTLLPGALLQWRDPSLDELFWLTLTAVFATTGHYTMTRALQAAPITVTQPISFLQLVWASLLGMFAFGEAVDPYVIFGGGIVVAAASYISHREATAARRVRTPPEAAMRL